MTKEEALAEAVKLCETLPKQTVARNLCRDYPQFFTSVDQARANIRYRTGSSGDTNRGRALRTGTITEPKLSTIAEGLAKLRSAPKRNHEPVRITNRRVLVLPDVHFPHHCPDSLAIAMEHGKKKGVDALVFSGDQLDFHKISRFTKEPDHMSPWEECEIAKDYFRLTQREFSGADKYFMEGNHDARLRHYLWTQAKELSDIPSLELKELLELDGFGIEYVDEDRLVMLGELALTHGHMLPMGPFTPNNPAATVYNKTKTSTMTGHFHKKSEYSAGNLQDRRHTVWTMGCLCNRRPRYSPFAYVNWVNGFAIVEVDSDGLFTVFNHSIIDGKVH